MDLEFYCNFCLVVHEELTEDHWWRGCKVNINHTIGCSQHKFLHHDVEYLVDECVCDTELCNKDMDPIPETTSTPKITTTSKGIHISYILHHLILYLSTQY